MRKPKSTEADQLFRWLRCYVRLRRWAVKRKLDASELATILAALRLFQRTYDGVDAASIRDQWDYFADAKANKFIDPLGTEDIDALCEEINSGEVTL